MKFLTPNPYVSVFMKAVLSVLFLSLLMCSVTARSQAPQLNSYRTAAATVYLDFDGQYVTGTSWNWNGDIDAQPAALWRGKYFQHPAKEHCGSTVSQPL